MARRRVTTGVACAFAAAASLLLSACSSGSGSGTPAFSPQVPFPGDGAGRAVPQGPPDPLSSAPSSPSSQPPSSGSTPNGTQMDPNVVATKLNSPVGLVVLPDKTALVGERATGRILDVQPVAGQPVVTVRTLNVDGSGDGGLLDLALSPSYAEDGLIFAYISTATDNRVVEFTRTGPATPVFTGIPHASTGNTGRIVFGADGDLYIGTGDAGRASNAIDPHSLAGKILRVTDIGKPAPGNPSNGSAIFASGFKEVDALCADPDSAWTFEADARNLAVPDVVSLVIRGDSYGYPSGNIKQDQTLASTPDPNRSPGGCTVDSQGNASTFYVTTRDGQALLGASLSDSKATPTLGKFTVYLAKRYGRLRSVVAAPDGTLWLTTSNRDGHGKPVPADERVLHIQQPNQGGSSPV